MKAKVLAEWFIRQLPELTEGCHDNNVRVNKLLYFLNLYYFSIFDEVIVDENFVAFPEGPVIQAIYRDYRYNGLDNYPSNDIKIEDSKLLNLLKFICFVYGNKTARELTEETHKHNLWLEVKDQIPTNPVINFNNASKQLIEDCKTMYKDYSLVDFDKIKKEIVNGNIYYYNTDNIKYLDDDTITKLLNIRVKNTEPQFIEKINGEIVFS